MRVCAAHLQHATSANPRSGLITATVLQEHYLRVYMREAVLAWLYTAMFCLRIWLHTASSSLLATQCGAHSQCLLRRVWAPALADNRKQRPAAV